MGSPAPSPKESEEESEDEATPQDPLTTRLVDIVEEIRKDRKEYFEHKMSNEQQDVGAIVKEQITELKNELKNDIDTKLEEIKKLLAGNKEGQPPG